MKRILLALLMFISLSTFSQNGMWAWMKGNNIANPPAVWGTQGVGAPANTPSAKYSSFHWQDADGNLWVFSGLGTNSAPPPYDGYDDVWKYDIANNHWIWMHGDSTLNALPVYGTIGVPSPTNTPGMRYFEGLCWTDRSGKFWLHTNVTWKYDPDINQWACMNGLPASNFPVYGTRGIPSANNRPGYVSECNSSWVDNSGNLWFYGGTGFQEVLLWKYDTGINQWAWMFGDTAGFNMPPVYGTLGVPDTSNSPGTRQCFCSWKDTSDNFYLFGGSTAFIAGPQEYNDVWRYTPSTNEWAWVSGDSGVANPANYGAYCSGNASYYPESRFENRACAMDSCGNVWIYGGFCTSGCTDLWVYNMYQNEWTLASGSPIAMNTPVYGTMGIPSVNNSPGYRAGAISWFDHNGNMWLLGGIYSQGYSNQLWKYIPSSTCITNANCVNVITGNSENNLSANHSDIPFSIEEGQLNIFPEGNFLNNNFIVVEIYDLIGQKNFSSIFYKGERISINISMLSVGIYIVRITDEKKNKITRKFAKI